MPPVTLTRFGRWRPAPNHAKEGQIVKTIAIVNPAAGSRRAARVWPRLLKPLDSRSSGFTTWWTEGPGHGEVLAAQARRQGYERVVAVGGDGTVSEVANGLWWEPRRPLPSLGIVPLGTGCDYLRNFTAASSLWDSLVQALGETTVAVSVALVQLQSFHGRPLHRICLNIMGLGFDARVVARMRRQGLPLAGKLPYLISCLQELLVLKHSRLVGHIDREPFVVRATLMVAALGRFFGGGIMIAPLASPGAPHFEVVWDDNLDRLALLSLLGKSFSGGHLAHPRVHSRFARHLEVAADPPAVVQVEGEPVGQTPVIMRLSPDKFHIAAN